MNLLERKILNQKLALEEFDQGRLALKARPSKLIVELNKYELWRHAKRPVHPMPLELFERVAAELFADAYFVDLRGFETESVAPCAPGILDRLKEHPFINWHLFTHLSLADTKLWQKIGELGFMIGFACDGISRSTVKALRPWADFDLMQANIAAASSAIARSGRGFMYMIVNIQRENMEELPAILELAHKHSIYQVQFKVLKDFTDEAARSGKLPQLVTRCLDYALERSIRLSINDQELFNGVDMQKIVRALKTPIPDPVLNFPGDMSALSPEFLNAHSWPKIDARVNDRTRVSVYKNCFKPFHYAHIAPDGRVGTCNHMLDPYIVEMGNLTERPFAEIWNGSRYQAFRKDLLAARPSDPRCQWCFEHRLAD